MKICLKNNRNEAYFEEKLNHMITTHDDLSLDIRTTHEKIDLKDIDVLLLSSNITKEELETANKLKLIIFPYTGVNHLPLQYLNDKGIIVVNSHAHAPIVALRAVSLALALLGRVVELHNAMKKGEWKGIDQSSTWTTILNLRCGMVGMGAIGQHIVKYLKPYNNEIVTLRRYEKRCRDISEVTYYDTIEEVCVNSDIIFISLPLTNQTKDIIDSTILSQLKDKYIVNVGRGELISEVDLYNALNNKTLKGAALDVWYQYPKKSDEPQYPSKLPIHQLDNVVLSPHCAGNSTSTRKLVIDGMISTLKSYVETNDVKNVVDMDKEY